MRVRGANSVGRAVRKGCAYGSNVVSLRYGDRGTREILEAVGSKV